MPTFWKKEIDIKTHWSLFHNCIQVKHPISIDCFKYEHSSIKEKGKKVHEWPLLVSKTKPTQIQPKTKNQFQRISDHESQYIQLRRGYREVITGNYTNKLTNTSLIILQVFLIWGKFKGKNSKWFFCWQGKCKQDAKQICSCNT